MEIFLENQTTINLVRLVELYKMFGIKYKNYTARPSFNP